MKISTVSNPVFPFYADEITKTEGTVLYDSSISSNGNTVITIRCKNSSNIYGNSAETTGLITAVINGKTTVSAGNHVVLKGYFSDTIFIVKDYAVIRPGKLILFRERLIKSTTDRLLGNTNDLPSILSAQLILGKSDTYGSEIKDLASSCGCLHVLALSGMHLNLFVSLCRIFGKHKRGKIITHTIITIFLFIAGPRPSLIRAALMFFLGVLPPFERIITTYLIQLLLFPYHLINIGCIYAYASIFALYLIAPYVTEILNLYGNKKIMHELAGAISVLILNAPIQLILDGKWYPAAIIAGPSAGILAYFSMLLGILILISGRLSFLLYLNEKVYSLLIFLFTFMSQLSEAGLTAYLTLLFTVLSVLCIFSFLPKHKTTGRLPALFHTHQQETKRRFHLCGKKPMNNCRNLSESTKNSNAPIIQQTVICTGKLNSK